MRLPNVSEPQRYNGLYVFDFGEWVALGYTAEEIAVLLESPEYREGKAYKICRATPNGQMELRGVSSERFQLESGIFFYCSSESSAREAFDELTSVAESTPPPTRAQLQLTKRGEDGEPGAFVVALISPAEYEDEIGDWLTAVEFFGGDWAEGGVSHVTNYYEERPNILSRKQLWNRETLSRSPEQVFSSVRRAVQR